LLRTIQHTIKDAISTFEASFKHTETNICRTIKAVEAKLDYVVNRESE